MKHRLILVTAISVSVLSLVGTLLVSASNSNNSAKPSGPPREEVVRTSERHETFCVAPIGRKPGKATITLTQPETTRPGQTATLLPDGRLLLVGGLGSQGPVATAEIQDINTGQSVGLANGLRQARAFHSATMLADGSVLIWGGVDHKENLIATAEIFRTETQAFEPFAVNGLVPRAHHSATLLMDGRVVIACGISGNGKVTGALELLDPQTHGAVSLPVNLVTARQNHTAYFLPDAKILFWGGLDHSGNEISSGEIFDVEAQTLNVAGEYARRVDGGAPYITGSSPKDGETSVPRDSRIAVRFSKPLLVETVNDQNVTLSGPAGRVAAKIVPAENGMLAFITPAESLAAGSMFTLSISNATDKDGFPVPPASITFMTVGGEMQEHAKHDVKPTTDATPEFDTPQPANADNKWRSLSPLQAAPGVTAFAGQVLRVSGQPLPNVTIQIGENAVRTDSTGRFLLTDIPAGHQEFLINGETASKPNKLYATCEEGVDIVAGKTNVLSYTIWLPVVDTQHATTLPVPTTQEIVATNPLMPGLEMHIPAGVRLKTHNGTYLTTLALTPVPLDRTPLPLPPGTAYYFTPQTHDSVIETVDGKPSAGIRIVFPNVKHFPPGTQVDLYDYSSENGWYVYGQGTVTRDGSQVAPNPGVGLQKLNCNNSMANPSAPGTGPAPGNGTSVGDPVDLGTGLFVYRKTDLVLPDTIPIMLTRTYRQNDGGFRAFGIGTTHPYDMYLSLGFWSTVDLILPDGGRIHYDEISPGTFIYQHTSTPTKFYKSTLTRDADGFNYTLRLLDGTIYHFFSVLVCCNQFTHQYRTGLDWIQDRYGNRLTITRDASYQISRITSPNGRWVELTYGSGLITQARDSIGRTVNYGYDPNFRLTQVTDVNGGITQYTYDPDYSRMLTIKDPRNIVYLTNEYDANGRVRKQTQADNGFYQFTYTLDGNGNVTQTDVTDPRGFVRRTTFNSSGYTLTDTFALGRPEQQVYTYTRQAGSNLITNVLDPLGRNTSFVYDSFGNITSVTKLAGTSEAVASSATYEPTFNQLATVTDPLNHTNSYAYDAQGRLTTVTDVLNHQFAFTYNAAGQLLTSTDPLQQTYQFTYDSGDLVAITDPLNRTINRFVDGAGRISRVTSPSSSTTQVQFSTRNQPTRVTDALLGPTAFDYDANGNLLTVTDARNNVTTNIYDNMDRLATRRDQLQHNETFQYDLNGNLKQITDRKNQITGLAYDALNRLTQINYADSSSTSYTYDAGNRLTQVVDSASGTITYGYDNLDRLTSKTTPQGIINYTYDVTGRRLTMTVAGQPTVNYTYDNGSRLTQVSQGGASVSFAYDAVGRLTSMTLPNGIVAEYAYDLASQLTSLTYRQGGNLIGDLTYEYDANGHRTKMGGSLARSITPSGVASATYNAANQQLSFGNQTLGYDLNGNLVNDGANTYAWDARNHLTAISGPNVNASFLYDATGHRVGKTVNGITTSFLYDGANIVQEQSVEVGNANLLNGGIDEIFLRNDNSGSWTPLVDGLGSQVALTDASGTTQTQYSYGAFGQAATDGTSSSNANQYTGRENDGTGLQYNRARYYSPTLQRFISEDPLGFAGGDINLYAYGANSPTNSTDPSGAEILSASQYEKPIMIPGRKDDLDALGFMANAAAGFGDGIGAMMGPPGLTLLCPSCNPVSALRGLTPGGGAVDPHSGPYLVGQGGSILWGMAMGGAVAGGAGGGAALESELPGLPSSAQTPLGLGSTGRAIPANLSEQLAMEEAMSNPSAGTPVRMSQPMQDPRWPGTDGWLKMRQNINGNDIHYLWNRLTGAVDDFKFK